MLNFVLISNYLQYELWNCNKLLDNFSQQIKSWTVILCRMFE
jgi:hypothetical protein